MYTDMSGYMGSSLIIHAGMRTRDIGIHFCSYLSVSTHLLTVSEYGISIGMSHSYQTPELPPNSRSAVNSTPEFSGNVSGGLIA